MVINASLTEEHDQEKIASLSAALYKHANQIIHGCQDGNQTEYVVVQCSQGYMVTTAVDGHALLAVIAGSDSPLEHILSGISSIFQRHFLPKAA